MGCCCQKLFKNDPIKDDFLSNYMIVDDDWSPPLTSMKDMPKIEPLSFSTPYQWHQ